MFGKALTSFIKIVPNATANAARGAGYLLTNKAVVQAKRQNNI